MNGVHRRGLLRRAVAVAATVKPTLALASATGFSPDAPLIAWCAAFNAHQQKIEAAYRAVDDWAKADAAVDGIKGEQRALLNLICTNPPTTLEGVRAVAASLLHSMAELDPLQGDEAGASDEQRLQVALLRGLLRDGAA